MGDSGLAGSLTLTGIRCHQPGVAGLTLAVLGTTPSGVLAQVILSSRAVDVRIFTGSGATYAERNFSAGPAASFDPARGARFESTLAPSAGTNPPGSLGAVTSASGSIDCGDQRPGSSSLVLAGTGADGAFGPKLDPVRVQCDQPTTGATVQATGIAQIGGNPALALIAVRASAFTLFTSAGGQTHLYTAPSAAVTALTTSGARLDGNAVEAATAGGAAHVVHVVGELVCGVTGQF